MNSVDTALAAAATSASVTAEAAARVAGDALKVFIQTPTTDADRGPKTFYSTEATFSGTVDPVTGWGYNTVDGVNSIKATDSHMEWHVEGHYNDGTANRKMESYLQIWDETHTVQVRPIFFQWDKTAKKITGAQLSFGLGGSFEIRQTDNIVGSVFTSVASFSKAQTTLFGITGQNTVLSLGAATGQDSRLMLGRAAVEAWGEIRTEAVGVPFTSVWANSTRIMGFCPTTSGGAAGAAVFVGVVDNSAAGCFKAGVVGAKALYGRAFSAGQTASIFEAQDSSGAYYSKFDKAGYFMTKKTSAPADADLAAGEMALWFDSTNGAAKLMVKAKEAGGTVRTASVALA